MTASPARQQTYELLALAFRRPSPQQLEVVTAYEALDVFTGATAAVPWPASTDACAYLRLFLLEARSKGLAALANGLPATKGADRRVPLTGARSRGLAALARSLSVEYCRLFVGPQSVPCPPYGSVYLDGGQAMGPSAIDALSRYRQAGLRPARIWREPPDHIAVELQFMAHLSAKCAVAAAAGQHDDAPPLLEIQRAFLRDHVGRWGPVFAERLKRAASCHLYRFLGEFLGAWLTFDEELLDAVAEELTRTPAECE